MLTSDISVEERDGFLSEIEAVYRRYRLIIDSCGCCGSPWVTRPEESVDASIDHLRKNFPTCVGDPK